jgi:hypothetical protein
MLKMCQIQIIKKLDGSKIKKKDIEEFNKLMCFGSMRNDDAFGLFTNNYVFKNKGKFNTSFYNEKDLCNGDFIVGHNRFSTSGFETKWEEEEPVKVPMTFGNILISSVPFGVGSYLLEKERKKIKPKKDINRNHHPFVKNNFVLMHNGIISNADRLRTKYNINSDITTDSYVILCLIDYYFNKSEKYNRMDKIVEAIGKTTMELDGGYSVFLYDQVENLLFYFKNYSTEFSFYKYDNKILCGSTAEKNLDYVYFDSREGVRINIDSNKVYLITNNPEKPIKEVGSFKEKAGFFFSWFSNTKEDRGMLGEFFKENLGFIPEYKICDNGWIKIRKTEEVIKEIKKITDYYELKGNWINVNSEDLYGMKGGKKKKNVVQQPILR